MQFHFSPTEMKLQGQYFLQLLSTEEIVAKKIADNDVFGLYST